MSRHWVLAFHMLQSMLLASVEQLYILMTNLYVFNPPYAGDAETCDWDKTLPLLPIADKCCGRRHPCLVPEQKVLVPNCVTRLKEDGHHTYIKLFFT